MSQNAHTVQDFLDLVTDELGLPLADGDLDRPLDEVAGWDSLHLLALCRALERATGKPISLPAVLQAPNLAGIHAVAVGR
jgi:acyl carrier protein